MCTPCWLGSSDESRQDERTSELSNKSKFVLSRTIIVVIYIDGGCYARWMQTDVNEPKNQEVRDTRGYRSRLCTW
jgi:hypothetical protein